MRSICRGREPPQLFAAIGVKGALLEIRAFGCISVLLGIFLMGATVSLTPFLIHATETGVKLYWLVVPSALGISAGYVILFYATEWVERTFERWVDHPLVPQDLIWALVWELRISGIAFTLFGLGAASVWLRAILGG